MKKHTFILSLALGSFMVNAQTDVHNHSGQDPHHSITCGTSHAINKLHAENPSIAAMDAVDQAEFQAHYEDFLAHWSPGERSSYVVPMVVHIVHLGGPENISDEQVFDAIAQLNRDFNMENDDLDETIPEFAGITGNCDIEFRLATKDNSGQCHSGITRTYSSTTYDTGLSGGGHPIVSAVADEHGNWPQNKYMNVFVCIDPNGTAGYTYRPANWYPANGMIGGIMMGYDYMGSIGTSSEVRAHTLTHEVGHWLNLAHPWGGSNTPGLTSNCGMDDGVADTPNTRGTDNCSDLYSESCGSLDNIQNFMDYSYCSTMFTEGQAVRVQAALTGDVAERFKLFTDANLSATGVNAPGDLCEAKFSADLTTVCQGNPITFTDQSYHNVTSRTWTFEGGAPATSTSANPTVVFATPGSYDVTLTVNNGGDSETTTLTDYIVVHPNNGAPLPYRESFETLSEFPDNERFTIKNSFGPTWEITDDAASHGSKSVYISNYGTVGIDRDDLISGTIDLSDVESTDEIIFNFKYAYVKRNAGGNEWIRLYVSKDCGETWALRKNISGDDLSETVFSTPYTAEPGDWVQVDIDNIFSDYFVRNFMYRIEFKNDNGNNVFVDDINVFAASTIGLNNETANEINVSVYPNPLGATTTLSLDGLQGEEFTVALYSTIGQKITNVYSGTSLAGTNTIEWSTADLSKGIYLLRIESAGQTKTIKLIKD